MSMTIKGLDGVMKRAKGLQDAPRLFDSDFRSISLKAIRTLKTETPKDTGDTARAWFGPEKRGDSDYVVSNDKVTSTGVPMIQILEEGRKEVRPIRAKFLYIPLTERGKSRDSSAEFGVDFVLAKKSRAVKGKKFIEKINKDLLREMVTMMQATIRRHFSGQ